MVDLSEGQLGIPNDITVPGGRKGNAYFPYGLGEGGMKNYWAKVRLPVEYLLMWANQARKGPLLGHAIQRYGYGI